MAHNKVPLRLITCNSERPAEKPKMPRKAKGKYNYPKSLLIQEYFCRRGDGTWCKPAPTLSLLTDPKFFSPLGALLDQLEAEGHDVSGPRIEWLTFRELAARVGEAADAVRYAAMGIGMTPSRVMPIAFD